MVFVPFGLSDLFAPVARPNKKHTTKEIYTEKVRRSAPPWPKLQVIPWEGAPRPFWRSSSWREGTGASLGCLSLPRNVQGKELSVSALVLASSPHQRLLEIHMPGRYLRTVSSAEGGHFPGNLSYRWPEKRRIVGPIRAQLHYYVAGVGVVRVGPG